MTIKTGDLVRFKKGLYQEEEGLVYLLLEVNGDRSIIEWVNTKMTIRPTSVAMVADLEIYMDGLQLKELINNSSES
jgi:hypothetical protein